MGKNMEHEIETAIMYGAEVSLNYGPLWCLGWFGVWIIGLCVSGCVPIILVPVTYIIPRPSSSQPATCMLMEEI